MSAAHTPTPWSIDQYGTVNAPNGRVLMINGAASVCSPGDAQDEAKANARFIVHAVNCHDELLALAVQYRDDLRRPPAPDSIERRLERVNAAITKALWRTPNEIGDGCE